MEMQPTLQGALVSMETIHASKRSDQLPQQLPLEPAGSTAWVPSALLIDCTFWCCLKTASPLSSSTLIFWCKPQKL